ncbi:polysaccharide deacetylase [Epidermidibacterium keratini]|uniref:Polysaccharide deacetylase n=1 Tax=Epidermidibacterium keratini TaxID=1891644 RepID=A0A7L4YL49_9ACTN|nr:polysaccharide deacetylase family protein [Epidermidibacterium keratini]QHB99276.1 polysaccharide deacetylase [Epidermidibacterium keratini]
MNVRLRSRALRYAVLLIALIVAGCTSGATAGKGGAGGAGSSSATPTVSPEDQLIQTAQQQAAQYDYDGAIGTLQTMSGNKKVDAELQKVQSAKASAVAWPDNTTIPHIFYHSLIVDPARAFNSPQATGYSQYMVTLNEFTAQLQQIYDNGYVLIHPDRIASPGPDGAMVANPILLPPGKKPLVLSIDDVSYYEYMEGDGFPDKLVVASDGRVRNVYTDAAGNSTEGSYDVMPIIDDFVAAHPDFSYRGDKGTIALTGYNGVLGYRTSVKTYGDNATTKAEQAAAKPVADAIKAAGWRFASHSWGHIDMTKSSAGTIKADAQLWDAEVRPIVGDTPYLVYPFGADIAGVEQYAASNPKFAFLHDTEAFSYYFPVDASQPYWMQMGPQSVRQARINIDGITLQRALDGKTTVLNQFFDPQSTIDPQRPLPVPGP